jgi:hypothetical protein
VPRPHREGPTSAAHDTSPVTNRASWSRSTSG